MVESRASYRYAKAIIDHARHTGAIEETVADFATLEQAIASSRELALLLERPTVPVDKKEAILVAIFESKVSSGTLAFLRLITSKERSAELPGVVASFKRQIDSHNGVAPATIESAHELDDDIKAKISAELARLTGMKIVADWQVKPGLIGGFTARVGDKMIDASVQRQLERLRETLAADSGTWTPTL